MDHSVRGYLCKRSTKELDAFLKFCLAEKNFPQYYHVIPEILDVLAKREGVPSAFHFPDSHGDEPLREEEDTYTP